MLPCRGCGGRMFAVVDFTVKRRDGWDFYPGGEVYTATHKKCHSVRVLTKAQFQALRTKPARV